MSKFYFFSLILVFKYTLLCNTAQASDCSKNIVEHTCRVESLLEIDMNEVGIVNYFNQTQDPECAEDSNKYGKILLDVYSNLPEHSKTAFCSIKRILIMPEEANYGGAASKYISTNDEDYSIESELYNDYNMFKSKVLGYILRINITRFNSGETRKDYLTRMYSMPFEVRGTLGKPVESLPIVVIDSKPYKYDNLLATIIHEMGHFLDFSNNVTFEVSIQGDFHIDYSKFNFFSHDYPFTLHYEQNHGFMDKSWYYGLYDSNHQSSEIEIEGEVYSNLSFTPFAAPILRHENHPVSNDRFEELYRELLASRFISFYSISSPAEDFAETYLYYLDGKNVRVQKDGHIYYDESLKYLNDRYFEKIKALEKIMDLGFENEIGKEIEIPFWSSL